MSCFPEGPSEQTKTNNSPERSQILDAGGKPECPEKTCRSKFGLETNGHPAPGHRIKPGLRVHSEEEVQLRYLLPQSEQ